MVQNDIGLITAFVAGFVSFVSPCVLPLVPAYLSFMSGVSLAEMKGADRDARKRGAVLLSSLFFVLGFSVIFVALGATASVVGRILEENLVTIARFGGAIIIVLGLHMTGLLKIRFLAMERRFQAGSGAGLATSFVMGLAFAFGWTPCIGPILAVILGMAADAETVSRGIVLLVAYSLGLGIPFVLAGLFLNAFYGFFGRIQNHFHKIEVGSGIILILVGIALLFDKWRDLTGLLSQWLPTELG